MNAYYENGDKTRQRSIPIAIRGRFTNQNTVEDKIAQAKLYSTYKHKKYICCQ